MADTIIYVDCLNAKEQFRWQILRCQAAKGALLPPKEAVQWYRKLAKRGNAFAEFELGKCYENGDGVRKNCKTAVDCYRLAKDLAIMYRAKNPDTAYLESEQQIRESFVITEEDPDSFAQYEQERFELYNDVAESADAADQYQLGEYYFHGIGVDTDYKEAFYWWQKSAVQGYAKGQCSLAHCYQYGQGVEKNLQKAIYWYYQSAKQGYDVAQERLGSLYYDGKGVAKSYKEAAKWFRKSAKQTFRWVEMMEI